MKIININQCRYVPINSINNFYTILKRQQTKSAEAKTNPENCEIRTIIKKTLINVIIIERATKTQSYEKLILQLMDFRLHYARTKSSAYQLSFNGYYMIVI